MAICDAPSGNIVMMAITPRARMNSAVRTSTKHSPGRPVMLVSRAVRSLSVALPRLWGSWSGHCFGGEVVRARTRGVRPVHGGDTYRAGLGLDGDNHHFAALLNRGHGRGVAQARDLSWIANPQEYVPGAADSGPIDGGSERQLPTWRKQDVVIGLRYSRGA